MQLKIHICNNYQLVSKLSNDLVTFELDEASTNVTITCKKSKFDIIGISANEFPEIPQNEIAEENAIEIEVKPLEQVLMESCNKLRSNMSGINYMYFVMGLVFLKFASLKFEKRRTDRDNG